MADYGYPWLQAKVCECMWALSVSHSAAAVSSLWRYMQGYHFSGISGKLEMSGNSAKVSDKSERRPSPKSRKGQGICLVREMCSAVCMDTFLDQHVTYLYFIRTEILFSYALFTENLE